MRIAPLAFALDSDSADSRRSIRDVARITHRNEEAYAGALAVVLSVRYAAKNSSLKGMLSLLKESLPDTRVREALDTIEENGARLGCDSLPRKYAEPFLELESVGGLVERFTQAYATFA